MLKRILLKVVLVAAASCAAAQDIPKDLYVAASIPEELKGEANSVRRYALDETTITAPGHVVNHVHTVVTVLNEKGIAYTGMAISYDKESYINSFLMNVYDADGKLVKKYRKSDMYDRSAEDDVSIVTDQRVKAVGHTVPRYPMTFEVDYEVEYKSSLGSVAWRLQLPQQAVQNSYCKYTVLPSVGFKYRAINTNIKPAKEQVKGNDVYSWEVHNLKVEKEEEGAPYWKVVPRIDFCTDSFQYGGNAGNMASWENFGKWIAGLNSDVNTLPPDRAEKVRQMTANLKTDKEKARFLYEYLQKNMRYVSIQLGIGGFKPFPAVFVDDKKYGDCKALSNYMYAMLKAVNIPAYYAIIRAGENEEPADLSFSQNRFNHAIICIPFKNDTTWLECTSSTQPFGVLGTFTENRNALLITESGGKLVNTPRSKAAENMFDSKAHIKLNADGSALATVEADNTGEYRSLMLGFAHRSLDERKEAIIRMMHMKQPYAINITDVDDKDGIKKIRLEMDYDKFCDIISGNKQFYKPSAFQLWSFTCDAAEHRKNDFYFEHPLQKRCVTTIDLPEGFEVESLPAAQSLKFTYGNFETSYAYDAAKNQVTATTKFVLNNHIIPAAGYNEMQQYMDAVAKAQNKRLVIRRKA